MVIPTLPGNLNISVEGVDGAALLGLQPVTAVSSVQLARPQQLLLPCPHSTGTLGTTGLCLRAVWNWTLQHSS